MSTSSKDFLVRPDPLHPRLTERVTGIDQTGQTIETRVTVERALTIFLNSQEIVTAMTINDYPEYLALGYLLNQHMLLPDDVVTAIDYDEDLAVVVVRTKRKTNYEKKLKKKVQTSGCAQGTVFGDLMEALEEIKLPDAELRTSWLYALSNKINTTPSLYLEAGAIHGCVLAVEDRPLVYMEDVGRHNAVDKIAGWMFQHKVRPDDKIFYTTGRLTSEMVIKTLRMGIPILISRSGFTAWGVELARKSNLTLIGRAGGVSILERVLERLGPQCSGIILNANGDPRRFAATGLPVVPDDVPGFAGPLAGILAGLDWAAAHAPGVAFVGSVPGDCPFLPRDLMERLHAARVKADVPLACAKSGEWRHPVVGLWPVVLRDDLRHALVVEDLRQIDIWTARHGVGLAEWPDQPVDPFFNVNTPEDAARAEAI